MNIIFPNALYMITIEIWKQNQCFPGHSVAEINELQARSKGVLGILGEKSLGDCMQKKQALRPAY